MHKGIVSNNLFAYCDNNPVNKIDSKGNSALVIGAVNWWNPIGWVIGAIAAVVVVYTCVEIGIKAGKAISQIAKSKRTKIPSKLKKGDKVKTPTSHSSEFTKNKGGTFTHKKTGWKFGKSKDGHYGGDYWHAAPKNAKTGDYYNIGPKGNILG